MRLLRATGETSRSEERVGWAARGRSALRTLAGLLVLILPGHAVADYSTAARWYDGLTESERATVHVALILSGRLEASEALEYDEATFDAIVGFQRDQVYRPTGVLTLEQREALNAEAELAGRSLDLIAVDDPETGARLGLPYGYVGERESSASGGSRWTSEVYRMELETFLVPGAEESFEDLYAALGRGTNSRSVTYRLMATGFFIVAGRDDGRMFYTRFQWAPAASVGFTLTWSPDLTFFRQLAARISNSLSVRAAPAATVGSAIVQN